MARRLSMATRDELLAAIRSRYGEASRAEKARILDELVAVSGYHRKHAIRLLGSVPKPAPRPRPARRRYGEAVREALIALWEASDRICSKRLKPLIPVLLPALERHGAADARRASCVLACWRSARRPWTGFWRRCGWSPAAGSDGAPASARRCAGRFRCARSATGTTRRRATSRSISSPTAALRPPAASCRRWC